MRNYQILIKKWKYIKENPLYYFICKTLSKSVLGFFQLTIFVDRLVV